MEQIAAVMPRTNSDLLEIEGMTKRKVERYGPKIMGVLKSYWTEVDCNFFDILANCGGSLTVDRQDSAGVVCLRLSLICLVNTSKSFYRRLSYN